MFTATENFERRTIVSRYNWSQAVFYKRVKHRDSESNKYFEGKPRVKA